MYPGNESQTIELYKSVQAELGWNIVHLQATFPDAVIENSHGKRLVAEFEYSAKNFSQHGHNPSGCDLIICWENNWPESPLPVWALDGVSVSLRNLTQVLSTKTVEFEEKIGRLERNRKILKELALRIPKFYGPIAFNQIGNFYTLEKMDVVRMNAFDVMVQDSEIIQREMDEFAPALWLTRSKNANLDKQTT